MAIGRDGLTPIFHMTTTTTTIAVGAVLSSVEEVTTVFAGTLDAVLILGGGAPSTVSSPPRYVETRCDAAAAVHRLSPLPLLCLSAGTAHVSQLMSDGSPSLPIWESTASAGYLLDRHPDVPPSDLYVETTSYDTVSNAYFARTSHTDVNGWRRLLVVTNAFHLERTKLIFDWVFSLPGGHHDGTHYELFYLACPDTGLTPEAVEARAKHERRGAANVRDRLVPSMRTLPQLWRFLTHEHDFHTAHKLVARAGGGGSSGSGPTTPRGRPQLLLDSYGGGAAVGSTATTRRRDNFDRGLLSYAVFVTLALLALLVSGHKAKAKLLGDRADHSDDDKDL